jgi:Mg2+ and Co2+ transporter CorA
MTQKESKLNLEMAAQQRRLAHASKRDSTAMKTLSLLGAIFLPGTFLSSVFSMTFFNFRVGESKQQLANHKLSPLSPPSTTFMRWNNN